MNGERKKKEETTPKHTLREATAKRIWRKKEAKKNNTNTNTYTHIRELIHTQTHIYRTIERKRTKRMKRQNNGNEKAA